ncbi:hypothetical protein PMAYCL1PPCAC_13974, partial [Pristionchus mayeri]
KAVKQSRIGRFRGVLDSFTTLPSRLAKEDTRIEEERVRTNGYFFFEPVRGLRPNADLMYHLSLKYCLLIFSDTVRMMNQQADGSGPLLLSSSTMQGATEIAVANAKGSEGLKAMAELHKHLGNAKTYCIFCNYNTGDRDGFYAHLMSSYHMKAVGKDSVRFDLPTILVNVHKKNLVD